MLKNIIISFFIIIPIVLFLHYWENKTYCEPIRNKYSKYKIEMKWDGCRYLIQGQWRLVNELK